jgi:hypothetical protein
MGHRTRKHLLRIAALVTLLLGLVPGAALVPDAVQAEGRYFDEPASPGADMPEEEIVYIDKDGFIRVLDPYNKAPAKKIEWVSPNGSWRNMALGDMDGNQDLEIVAIRGSQGSSTAPEWAIFDPVVTSNPVAGQEINGVPWKQVYQAALPARPEVVATGNFDPNVSGDEVLIIRETASGEANEEYKLIIYKRNGNQWVEHQTKFFDDAWDRVAVGNITGQGGDEFALVGTRNDSEGRENGRVEVYQPDQGLKKLFEAGSAQDPWKDVAFGQYFSGGPLELLLVRDTDDKCVGNSPACYSFLVYRYENDTFVNSGAGSIFFPTPRVIFAGNTTGDTNTDSEAVIMRRAPEEEPNTPRLFVRGDGADGIPQAFIDGIPLDKDSGYRYGAAGDIDGDGIAEIVIIRNNNIRWFKDANQNTVATDGPPTTTNERSIAIGDLDRAGSFTGPALGATPLQIIQDVYLGLPDEWGINAGTINVQNISTNDSIPFEAIRGATYLSLSPTTGVAPGVNVGSVPIRWAIDTDDMVVGETWATSITIRKTDPNQQVANSPLTIPVSVTVKAPPYTAVPNEVFLYDNSCDTAPEQKLTFYILGAPGSRLESAIVTARTPTGEVELGAAVAATDTITAPATITYTSRAPWITAVEALTDTIPTTLTLTVSPTLRTADLQLAQLVLRYETLDGGIENSSHNIRLWCTASELWLPKVDKQAVE